MFLQKLKLFLSWLIVFMLMTESAAAGTVAIKLNLEYD